jgi:hypothetical protein
MNFLGSRLCAPPCARPISTIAASQQDSDFNLFPLHFSVLIQDPVAGPNSSIRARLDEPVSIRMVQRAIPDATPTSPAYRQVTTGGVLPSLGLGLISPGTSNQRHLSTRSHPSGASLSCGRKRPL